MEIQRRESYRVRPGTLALYCRRMGGGGGSRVTVESFGGDGGGNVTKRGFRFAPRSRGLFPSKLMRVDHGKLVRVHLARRMLSLRPGCACARTDLDLAVFWLWPLSGWLWLALTGSGWLWLAPADPDLSCVEGFRLHLAGQQQPNSFPYARQHLLLPVLQHFLHWPFPRAPFSSDRLIS